MARTTLDRVRSGLAANIHAAIPGIQCNGYLLSSPTAPGFEIEPGEIEYDLAMGRGLDMWTLIVRGYVSDVSDIGAQKTLDSWLASSGALSVKAAIQSDKTLGGACSDLRVAQVSGYRRYGAAANSNVSFLGAEWTVVVYGTGI